MSHLLIFYPHQVFMLRGNHETRSVNGDEGWYGQKSFFYQCKSRFGESLGAEVYEEVTISPRKPPLMD